MTAAWSVWELKEVFLFFLIQDLIETGKEVRVSATAHILALMPVNSWSGFKSKVYNS